MAQTPQTAGTAEAETVQPPNTEGAKGNTDAGTDADVIARLAGIAPGSPLAAVWATRPAVVQHTAGSFAALFAPHELAGLSRTEREAVALRVAAIEGAEVVATWHRERLRLAGVGDSELAVITRLSGGGDENSLPPRLAAILRHTDLLTRSPGAATPADLAALKAAGLGPREIVSLSQLIAYMSYAVRLLAGLRVLDAPTTATNDALTPAPVTTATDAANAAPANSAPRPHFTMDVLAWHPWLETVDDTGATPEQAALVERVAPSPESRPYYALLAHDVLALEERTALFNAIMYGPGGVRRADREFASTAASLVNGCVYCTSVHARRYAQLTKDAPTMQRLLDDGLGATLPEREQAVADYAVRLTRDPAGLAAGDLAALRAVGLSDAEIYDVTLATAMFAWANRLMQTLGEGVSG